MLVRVAKAANLLAGHHSANREMTWSKPSDWVCKQPLRHENGWMYYCNTPNWGCNKACRTCKWDRYTKKPRPPWANQKPPPVTENGGKPKTTQQSPPKTQQPPWGQKKEEFTKVLSKKAARKQRREADAAAIAAAEPNPLLKKQDETAEGEMKVDELESAVELVKTMDAKKLMAAITKPHPKKDRLPPKESRKQRSPARRRCRKKRN